MALILRYFTEFGSFRGALRKSDWQSHNCGQFTITYSKRLPRDAHGPPYKYSVTRWLYCVEWIQYSTWLEALGYLCDYLCGRPKITSGESNLTLGASHRRSYSRTHEHRRNATLTPCCFCKWFQNTGTQFRSKTVTCAEDIVHVEASAYAHYYLRTYAHQTQLSEFVLPE